MNCPLFDLPQSTRYIRRGYRMASECGARGLPPVSFAVEQGQP
jgi:hypothetical protein